MKFSLVIPTYKRPQALRDTLVSVLGNDCLPDEVLVIDDDETPEALITEMKTAFNERGVRLAYHKKDHSQIRRGLSESKNWAIELAQREIIYFLDDDVVLETDYFSALLAEWEARHGDNWLAGIGGRIINNRLTGRLEQRFRRFFGLSGECAWDVNDVAFQSWDESVRETETAYYIHGGVSSYRRSFLLDNPFATFSGGRTGLEDVEHCLAAKRAGYHFVYAPQAGLQHYPAPAGREQAFLSGRKESANRKDIFRRHCLQDFRHKLWFAWANLGWIFKKLAALRFREASGMIVGIVSR